MAMWKENLADKRPLSCLRAAQCALELKEKLNGCKFTSPLHCTKPALMKYSKTMQVAYFSRSKSHWDTGP